MRRSDALAVALLLVAMAAPRSGVAQSGPSGPATELLSSLPGPPLPTTLPLSRQGEAERQPHPITKTRERFRSGRDRVAVDVYTPPGAGPHPVVVLLHGARPRGEEAHYDSLATDLAAHGLLALRVHYYDRGRQGRGTRAEWMRTISDALTYADATPGADADRNAVVGFSLGAFLALAEAPRDQRIGAVVAFYGGIATSQALEAQRGMPPALLLHGTADRVVPVRRSLQAGELLRGAGRQADVVVYPGARHGFCLNRRGGADQRAARDAWERTLEFLAYHLACARDGESRGAASDPPSPRTGVVAATLSPHPPWVAPSLDSRTRVLINPDPSEVAGALAAARPYRPGPHRARSQRSASVADSTPTAANGS